MNDKQINSGETQVQKNEQKNYDTDEILSVISKTALSVNGVVRMSPLLSSILPEMPNSLKSIPVIGGSRTKGVRLTESNGRLISDLFVNVEYGSPIPQVAWDIQRAVEDAVYENCGIRISEINIHVHGVELPGEKEK